MQAREAGATVAVETRRTWTALNPLARILLDKWTSRRPPTRGPMHSTTQLDHTSALHDREAEGPRSPSLTGQDSSLLSRDGRPVCVVHLVAELAPFARTGGLGE